MSFTEEFGHLEIQLEDIKSATGDFGDDYCIGRGGFGKVYKGELSFNGGHGMVAIKRLNRLLGQGDPEFWKEVMMLSRYRHENLVSLLGFCDEGSEKILLYEYASNGSLDQHLSSTSLTWKQRLKICIGAAHGLAYLHDPKGTQQRVLHRDIKSSNILLDENWNAKISDFGLSKIGPANQQWTFLVSNAVGTLGYCDPLYMEIGCLTKESDVYSFGVVLFEVLCGRLCIENHKGECKIFVRMWQKRCEEEKVDEIIHENLKNQIGPDCLVTFSAIAYKCLQKKRQERPTMADIAQELEIALQLQENHDNPPSRNDTNYWDYYLWDRKLPTASNDSIMMEKYGLDTTNDCPIM